MENRIFDKIGFYYSTTLFGFLIFIILVLNFPLWILKNDTIYYEYFISPALYLVFIIATGILSILFWFLVGALHAKSCQAIFEYPELNCENAHDAIIIPHYKSGMKELNIDDCIYLLITTFQQIKRPYKVYHIFSKKSFVDIYENQGVIRMWIFGHGEHGGLKFREGFIDYSTLKEPPEVISKEFIAQFHCNFGKKKSLAEINQSEASYVSNFFRLGLQNRLFILKEISEIKRIIL